MPTPYTTNIGGELIHNYNNPFGGVTVFTGLLSQILGLVLLLGGVYVFVCLLWGGYQWLTAGDNEGSLQQAKDRLSHCLLGFTVLALSYATALLVQYFLGIQIFEPLPDIPGTPGVPTPTWGGPTPPCLAGCTQACVLGQCVTYTPTNTRTPTPTFTPTPTLVPLLGKCTADLQCASEFCGKEDKDGDLYAVSEEDDRCYRKIDPDNYLDCYDLPPSGNKTFPNEIWYYASDRGDGSFDYDCSGANDINQFRNCSTTYDLKSDCDTLEVPGHPGFVGAPPVKCGDPGIYRICQKYSNNICNVSVFANTICGEGNCTTSGGIFVAVKTTESGSALDCK